MVPSRLYEIRCDIGDICDICDIKYFVPEKKVVVPRKLAIINVASDNIHSTKCDTSKMAKDKTFERLADKDETCFGWAMKTGKKWCGRRTIKNG